MSDLIKRYNPCGTDSGGFRPMDYNKTGIYVRYDDYKELQAENAKLKEFGWKLCKDELPEKDDNYKAVMTGETFTTDLYYSASRAMWQDGIRVSQWLKEPEPKETND